MPLSDIRSNTEKKIAERTVDALLAADFAIDVNDGEATTLRKSTQKADILNAMGTSDEDTLYVHGNGRRMGYVWLIYGNGRDLLSDYSNSLDETLADVIDFAGEQD